MAVATNNTLETPSGATPWLLLSWQRPSPLGDSAVVFFGEKAAGLARLPVAWVPPFIVFSKEFHSEWMVRGRDYESLRALLSETWDSFTELTQQGRDLRTHGHLLVRSNGEAEGISQRGSAKSTVVECRLDDIARGVLGLFMQAGTGSQFPVVQIAIEPGVLGHISNERRISSRLDKWLVESTQPLPNTYYRTGQPAGEEPLQARNEKDLIACLGRVSGYLLSQERSFYHCEWIWDGQRVWIVQVDKASCPENKSLSLYLTSTDPPIPPISGSVSFVRHYSEEGSDRWHKLRCPLTFRRLGLPSADIFVLSGEMWKKSQKNQHDLLRKDLQRLSVADLVVRCDVSRGHHDKELLLPTSKPTKSAEELVEFMAEASTRLSLAGISDDGWAFLIAVLVPARAGVMIHALPGGRRVRVDAIWGFPDGLLYFPHDTYFYHAGSEKVTSFPRFKGTALFPQPDWRSVTVPAPFDWRRVLSNAEVKTFAEWGLALAKEVGHEVQLMGLARICGRRGNCLPWHFTTLSLPQHRASISSLPMLKKIEIISSEDDLRAVSQSDRGVRAEGFLIRPERSLLRDSQFLENVGKMAASCNKPIYFEGSLLGHAYYILASSGAPVIPVQAREQSRLERTTYGKLVRDHIPAVIQRAGSIARVRSLSRDEAKVLLAQKLIEEAFEVWGSTEDTMAEELADLLEVVDALRYHIGSSSEEIEAIRLAKKRDRGGFDRLIFLEETVIRSLESPADSEGTLPLLHDDLAEPRSASHLDFKPIQFSADSMNLSLLMPLIPPVRRGQPLKELVGHDGSFECRLSYNGAKARIAIQRKEPEDLSEQLVLFPELLSNG